MAVKALEIQPIEAELSLERLSRLGLITKTQSKWVVNQDSILTTDNVPSEALKKFHQQVLAKASSSIKVLLLSLTVASAVLQLTKSIAHADEINPPNGPSMIVSAGGSTAGNGGDPVGANVSAIINDILLQADESKKFQSTIGDYAAFKLAAFTTKITPTSEALTNNRCLENFPSQKMIKVNRDCWNSMKKQRKERL